MKKKPIFVSFTGLGSGFAIGYGTALLTRPRINSFTRPDNMGAEKGPLRCATTNTSVVFKKADYEQDIDIKQDELECKVHVPTMNEFVFACNGCHDNITH